MTDARKIAQSLLRWYDRAQRDMPWRHTRVPYAIWLSETMLQQTQVATVVPYYRRFLERFPTVAALAAAPLADVLSLWAGLGYYRRAKHLQPGRPGNRDPPPQSRASIGRGAAGAPRHRPLHGRRLWPAWPSTCRAPVVDGNVMARPGAVYGYDRDLGAAEESRPSSGRRPQSWCAPRRNRQVLGRRGRTATRLQSVADGTRRDGCLPPRQSRRVPACPLRRFCRAFAEDRQIELPVKSPKKAVPIVRRKALIILRHHRGRTEVLLMQRPAGGLWEHMWEFPVLPANEKRHGGTGRDAAKPKAVRHGQASTDTSNDGL